MNKTLTIDLSEDFTSDIIVLGRYKETANEFTALFKWSGATDTGGNFKLYGYVDASDPDSRFEFDSIDVLAETGEELRYSNVDIDAIQIAYNKATDTVGTAKVFIKMSERV